MPTRRGWGVLAGSAGVILLGRLLGLLDLYVVGVAGILLVGTAVGWVRLINVQLEATRRLRPARVQVGGSISVEIAVRNASRHRSPVLEASDSFDAGWLTANWLLAPLGSGESARTGYQLVTDRRGIFGVGPLQMELRDPFGLALASTRVLGSTNLIVLPLVEAISPPPRGRGGSAQGGAERPPFRGQSGDDFYALRPYSAGDDLRRVHWPSTARRGEIMIRQDDHPWQERTTVLLDTRSSAPEALEAAVSAAASVVSAARDELVRLVQTSGSAPTDGNLVGSTRSSSDDSGYGVGSSHLSAMLDSLAAVKPGGAEPAGQTSMDLRQVRDAPGGGTLVVVSSAMSRAELDRVASLSPKFTPVVVVSVQAGRDVGVGTPRGGSVRLVQLSPGRSFARAWADAAGTGAAKAPATKTRARLPGGAP